MGSRAEGGLGSAGLAGLGRDKGRGLASSRSCAIRALGRLRVAWCVFEVGKSVRPGRRVSVDECVELLRADESVGTRIGVSPADGMGLLDVGPRDH